MTTPAATTLIASANVGRVDGPARARVGNLFDGLTIGQNLKLKVLRQIEQHRYEVTFGGRRHVVESRVNLEAGTQIEARVESKADRLELRYLATDPRFADEQSAETEVALGAPDADSPAPPPWLAELAVQYRVSLDAQAQATIARSAAHAADPALMTRGGLFLQKIAHAVEPRDLEALYRALSAQPAAGALRAPIALELAGDEVATRLGDALDVATQAAVESAVPDVTAENGDPRGEDDARRAVRLLNLQDEGSVAWRYGTLPLLVGGQLIELDLVMFRERESSAARGGLKRLVMTLDTTHFGRVHVEARAVDTRLIVKLRAPTADAIGVLSAYGGEVRAALSRLGWAVDDIVYEVDAQAGSAARAVVDHVLSAGSVDREL